MDLSENLLTGSIPAPGTAATISISNALLVGLTETVAMRRLSKKLLDGPIGFLCSAVNCVDPAACPG